MISKEEKFAAARELHDKYKRIAPELKAAEEKANNLQREYSYYMGSTVSKDSKAMREKMSRAFAKVGDLYSQLGALRPAYRNYDAAQVYTSYDSVRNSIIKEMQKIDKKLKDEGEPKGNLERRAIASFAVLSLLGAMFSISMNLTGNVIGGSLDNNNWLSIGLFFLGCILTLFYFKAKNRITKKK